MDDSALNFEQYQFIAMHFIDLKTVIFPAINNFAISYFSLSYIIILLNLFSIKFFFKLQLCKISIDLSSAKLQSYAEIEGTGRERLI